MLLILLLTLVLTLTTVRILVHKVKNQVAFCSLITLLILVADFSVKEFFMKSHDNISYLIHNSFIIIIYAITAIVALVRLVSSKMKKQAIKVVALFILFGITSYLSVGKYNMTYKIRNDGTIEQAFKNNDVGIEFKINEPYEDSIKSPFKIKDVWIEHRSWVKYGFFYHKDTIRLENAYLKLTVVGENLGITKLYCDIANSEIKSHMSHTFKNKPKRTYSFDLKNEVIDVETIKLHLFKNKEEFNYIASVEKAHTHNI